MKRAAASGAFFVGRKGLLLVSALVLGAFAAACGSNQAPVNPAGPSVSAAANSTASEGPGTASGPVGAQGRTVAREVSGSLDGRFDFTRTWGSEWWQFYSDGDSTGTVNHLGLSRMYTTHIPNLGTGALEHGEFRIVAANGDTILGTFEGSAAYVSEDQLHGVATFVVSGGTGRFEGASGTIDVTFVETLDDPTWASAKVAWTLAGTVSY